MSSIDSLRDALADRIAAGWIALGGQLEGAPEMSVVDLEALVAVTSRMSSVIDARTRDVALDWCVRYGEFVSSVRLARVAGELDSSDQVVEFAAWVAASGGPRWSIAGDRRAEPGDVRNRVLVTDLQAAARLVWRLRAAFGVSARADILAAILVSDPRSSISDLSRRTRYAKRSVAVAVEALALGGLVEVERIGRVDRVRLAPDSLVRAWGPGPRQISPMDVVSRWRVAVAVVSVLAATESAPTAVAAIERRRSADALRSAIIAAELPRPDITVKGEAFGLEYERWAGLLARSIAGHR